MPVATFDMNDQARHLVEMMLALWQPALWLALCVGFVLASAHLLTMLGTQWGDRRVSPKALFFSIAIHLSLLVGVVALIPEYRQHILSIGQEEPPEVRVELLSRDVDQPADRSGNTPVWDRIPQQLPLEFQRAPLPTETPRDESEPDDRRVTIQLADRRPVLPTPLPEAPAPLPEPAAPEPSEPPPMPAETPAPEEPPQAEARPEAALPPPSIERSMASPPAITEAPRERPDAGAVERLTTEPRRDEPLASLTAPRADAPLLRAPEDRSIERNTGPAPTLLPTETPGINSQPAEPSPGSPGASTPQIARTRTSTTGVPKDEPIERTRPGVTQRPRESRTESTSPAPLLRRDEPELPELYRPEIDPARTVASLPGGQVPAPFRLRTDEERKDEAIRKFGGTEDSQRTVERAIAWLASVQDAQGFWDASAFDAGRGPPETDSRLTERRFAGRNADTGVTALAMLALLGNGNTLTSGPYAVHVDRAAQWLVSRQAASGSLAGNATVFEAMYCHGMAALALAEAYAMESDAMSRAALRQPLERALAYSAAAQLEDGGWRYVPPSVAKDSGDMSMFGWQLMAFKSAQDGGIAMPAKTRSAMIQFLKDRSRGRDGGLAGYRSLDPPTAAMTAEALACKQMLGLAPDNPMAIEGINFLMESRPRRSTQNLYYWYYGTLATFQHGGDAWTQWNNSLRDLLVEDQIREGPFAGSWEPRDQYSRYGGRIFSTAISTLCLEVYYRRLPMFQRGGKSP